MDPKLRRDVRLLKAYAIAMTLLLFASIASGFVAASGQQKFDVIDVERINVVEKNGTLRLVISNAARMPDAVVDGKTFKGGGSRGAGMIFYNDEGDENGGLVYHGARKAGRYRAGGALLFDKYKQDQVVGLVYDDENGTRAAGLRVWDRPDSSVADLMARVQAAERMPHGAEKDRAKKELEEAMKRGEFGAMRVFTGRTRDGSAAVVLSDTAGRDRLRLFVDAKGDARIEFLDEQGKVVSALPSK